MGPTVHPTPGRAALPWHSCHRRVRAGCRRKDGPLNPTSPQQQLRGHVASGAIPLPGEPEMPKFIVSLTRDTSQDGYIAIEVEDEDAAKRKFLDGDYSNEVVWSRSEEHTS